MKKEKIIENAVEKLYDLANVGSDKLDSVADTLENVRTFVEDDSITSEDDRAKIIEISLKRYQGFRYEMSLASFIAEDNLWETLDSFLTEAEKPYLEEIREELEDKTRRFLYENYTYLRLNRILHTMLENYDLNEFLDF